MLELGSWSVRAGRRRSWARQVKVATLCVASTFFVGATVASSAHGQASEFQKTQLVGDEDAGQPNTLNPMEIEVAPDGRVFYTERRGVVGVWDPATETSSEIGEIPVTTFEENGLMGIALAPDFETSGWIYLSYSALPLESLEQRVSRFQLDDEDDDLDMTSEQPVFEWTHLRETCCHSAGALEFDLDGNLLISTGDNTNPFESQGYAPIDERSGRAVVRRAAHGREHERPQRQAAADHSRTTSSSPGPSRGSTTPTTIPAGNMFEPGTADTQPEIYAMGFRNPFRFKIDEEDRLDSARRLRPRRRLDGPAARPAGQRRVQRHHRAGQLRLAVLRPRGYALHRRRVHAGRPDTGTDPDFESSEVPFDCEAPVNQSPNNTGVDRPASRSSPRRCGWAIRTPTPRVPGARHRRRPDGGPALLLRSR